MVILTIHTVVIIAKQSKVKTSLKKKKTVKTDKQNLPQKTLIKLPFMKKDNLKIILVILGL